MLSGIAPNVLDARRLVCRQAFKSNSLRTGCRRRFDLDVEGIAIALVVDALKPIGSRRCQSRRKPVLRQIRAAAGERLDRYGLRTVAEKGEGFKGSVLWNADAERICIVGFLFIGFGINMCHAALLCMHQILHVLGQVRHGS